MISYIPGSILQLSTFCNRYLLRSLSTLASITFHFLDYIIQSLNNFTKYYMFTVKPVQQLMIAATTTTFTYQSVFAVQIKN